jgi:predicted nucleic acid-binding protein
MVAYFDSSVLLSILFDEECYTRACAIWNGTDLRLSSFLTKIETNVSLRRYHKTSKYKNDDVWLSKKMDELYGMLEKIYYKPVDRTVEQIIDKNAGLAGCKSLDAIQLATFLYLKENSRDQYMALYKIEKNMVSVAKQLGLDVNIDIESDK